MPTTAGHPGIYQTLTKADRMRRPEVELERAVFSHPAQRRLAIQAMAAHDKRFPVTGRY
jgi:hypothetical protein